MARTHGFFFFQHSANKKIAFQTSSEKLFAEKYTGVVSIIRIEANEQGLQLQP